jgi:hypothetical protein
MAALVDAYALAKQHYLTLPGALKPRTGLARWLARRLWKFAGR